MSSKTCFLGLGSLCLVASALCLQHTSLRDSRQKEQMQKRNGGKMVDERQLFHGTSTGLVDAICQQNFDWRVSGLHGTSYGKGKCPCWQNPLGLTVQDPETTLKQIERAWGEPA